MNHGTLPSFGRAVLTVMAAAAFSSSCKQSAPAPESQAEAPVAAQTSAAAAPDQAAPPTGGPETDAPAAPVEAASPEAESQGAPSARPAGDAPPVSAPTAGTASAGAPPASPGTAPTPAPAPAPKATSHAAPAPAPAPKSAAGYDGDDPCSRTQFATGQVRAACRSGGRPAVKALMKNVVSSAKAAGESLKCSSCHASMKTYELKPNAVSDLKKWL